MQSAIPAVFYRGGTSRGIFFESRHLGPYSQKVRDRILCHSMGTPDPGGRQIDGLGGGISSLSKAAIVSQPGDSISLKASAAGQPLPGVSWADDVQKARDPKSGWDVVYRFGQVGVREDSVDWGSTCGNLVAAAAQFAIDNQCLDTNSVESLLSQQCEKWPANGISQEHDLRLRILAANTGRILRVKLPVIRVRSRNQAAHRWIANAQGHARIAGVPGTAASIIIEAPLETEGGGWLPTGKPVNEIDVDGQKVRCTIVDAGLPTIFVPFDTPFLALSRGQFLGNPADMDADTALMARLERVRRVAAAQTPGLQSLLSPPAPKICLVGPAMDYTSTEGVQEQRSTMHIVARALSSGNVHRTIPATALSALAVAAALPASTVQDSIQQSLSEGGDSALPYWSASMRSATSLSLTIGQPAGLSSATVALSTHNEPPTPRSIVMLRTARRIMEGSVLVPQQLTEPNPVFQD